MLRRRSIKLDVDGLDELGPTSQVGADLRGEFFRCAKDRFECIVGQSFFENPGA